MSLKFQNDHQKLFNTFTATAEFVKFIEFII